MVANDPPLDELANFVIVYFHKEKISYEKQINHKIHNLAKRLLADRYFTYSPSLKF
jgi:hypothetical protein